MATDLGIKILIFLYISSKTRKEEKEISFKIITEHIKYLGGKLPRKTQELYEYNHKTFFSVMTVLNNWTNYYSLVVVSCQYNKNDNANQINLQIQRNNEKK